MTRQQYRKGGGDKSGDGTYAPRSVCDFRFMVMHTREVPQQTSLRIDDKYYLLMGRILFTDGTNDEKGVACNG
jgi:hypothetical protein